MSTYYVYIYLVYIAYRNSLKSNSCLYHKFASDAGIGNVYKESR